MGKVYKIMLVLMILGFIGLIFLEANKPQPLNWSPSYHRNSKIPFGTYILHRELKNHFDVQTLSTPPYEAVNETLEGNYFFINNQLSFDKTELKKMLAWVEKGNTLFLAANHYSQPLLDTLGIEVKTAFNRNSIYSKPLFWLTHKQWATQRYQFERNQNLSYFKIADSLNYPILSEANLIDAEAISMPVYIKIPKGKGQILMHSMPQTLSNYFILSEDNYLYTEKILAYLPATKNLFWDAHYKAEKKTVSSPLYLLFKNKHLKWGYYLLVIGSILYVIFEGKRKQRSIKVIKPHKNQTYAFTQTVAQLFLEEKDYKNIFKKQTEQLYHYIRWDLHIDIPPKKDALFYSKLAIRTAKPEAFVISLFKEIEKINQQNTPSQKSLIALAKKINEFKNS
ncbi:MAG: DUF4350 domain-containing protein [Mesonia hippocampi]|uniref:DUF4350 domain-containing protein n=1 Tax=Mesonia hippocampi TaxID=1628250 RepID=UPI003F975058